MSFSAAQPCMKWHLWFWTSGFLTWTYTHGSESHVRLSFFCIKELAACYRHSSVGACCFSESLKDSSMTAMQLSILVPLPPPPPPLLLLLLFLPRLLIIVFLSSHPPEHCHPTPPPPLTLFLSLPWLIILFHPSSLSSFSFCLRYRTLGTQGSSKTRLIDLVCPDESPWLKISTQ